MGGYDKMSRQQLESIFTTPFLFKPTPKPKPRPKKHILLLAPTPAPTPKKIRPKKGLTPAPRPKKCKTSLTPRLENALRPKDYKSEKITGVFNDKYIEYKGPYLRDMIDNLRASGKWKIQLIMRITFMSSKDSGDKQLVCS